MSQTISEIEPQAKADVERIAAEAHRDMERITAEVSRALSPKPVPSGDTPPDATLTTLSDPTIPPPPPVAVEDFKRAFGGKASAPATDAQASAHPTQARRPWPSSIDLSNAHIGESVGKGGFGAVSWLDTGAADAPPLVIKQGNTPKDQAELQKEAEAYKTVGAHPNIARCLGMQTIDGKQGLVMEDIKGKSMSQAMDRLEKLRRGDKAALTQAGRKRALSQEEYVGTLQYMVTQILQGLVHLQQQAVAHNDIRPDNVMCDATTGEVKIVDFGLSFQMGLRPNGVQTPVGHGSAAPELATRGALIIGKADVFSAGEIARKGMEGDQFRYNTNKDVPKADDAKAFAQLDAKGLSQKSLNPKPQPSGTTASGGGSLDERLSQACSRLSGLIADPFIAGTEIAKRLSALLVKAPGEVAKAKAEGQLEKAEKLLDDLDEAVGAEEVRLKRTGTFGAETDYTLFVNALMHPDASKRLSAVDALRHSFLADRLLDDTAAQAVLKAVLADQPEVADADSSAGSFSSAISGSDVVPLNSSARNNASVGGVIDQSSSVKPGGGDRNYVVVE